MKVYRTGVSDSSMSDLHEALAINTRTVRRHDYKKVFDKVIMVYLATRTLSVTNSCGGFYSCLGQDGMDKGNSRAIIPMLSDLICDVELAAKHALRFMPHDFVFFKAAYLDQSVDLTTLITNDPKYERIVANITQLVGREFVRRRIHPLSNYFKAKVVFPR